MSRVWKTVPLPEAKSHHLYGVKNWLAVFGVGVLLSLLREVGELNGEAHKLGLTIGQMLSIDHPAVSFVKTTLILNVGMVSAIYWMLFSKHPKFRFVSSSLLLLSWPAAALIAAINPFDGIGGALGLSLIPWLLSCGVWVTYLNRSRRVRVTFENQILQAESISERAFTTANNSARQGSTTLETSASVSNQSSPQLLSAPSKQEKLDQLPRKLTSASSEICEDFWATALSELDGPMRKDGLWAKAFAMTNGNEAEAKAAYLRERVKQIEEEAENRNAEERIQLAAAAQASAKAKELELTVANVERLKSIYVSGGRLSPEDIAYLSRAIDIDNSLPKLWERLKGETLLHWCSRYNLHEEARLLIEGGANIDAVNGNGQKPFALAPDRNLRNFLTQASRE